jgi:RNA polymerase sigma factor (sigma-70 family)
MDTTLAHLSAHLPTYNPQVTLLVKQERIVKQEMAKQDQRITETITRERGRLGSFIRRRVPDPDEAEDILQDVFFEFVEAYRLPEPIEQVGAWLFRVARNRIIDSFRKKREEPLPPALAEDGDSDYWLEQALPDPSSGPEAVYARAMLLEAISIALDELPARQRDVFIAHELDGHSFKEMAAQSGENINTLLGLKRLAVLHLRSRLQPLYHEFYQ